MSIPDSIKAVCDSLRPAFNQAWDADDGMDGTYVRQSPLGRLVGAYEAQDALEALKWLTFFAAKRALPCWELYCDNTQPQQALDAAEQWLQRGIRPTNVSTLATAAQPVYRGQVIGDCRYCDTVSASSAAAELIRFLDTSNTLHAIYCLSAADVAFDQSPLGSKDHFREWLFDYAVPSSFERRTLTDSEQNVLREYDAGGISKMREQEASYWNGVTQQGAPGDKKP